MYKLLPLAIGAIVISTTAPVKAQDHMIILQGCDIQRGENLFKKCAVCHSNDTTGKHGKVGPNLHNIIDRDVGKISGYKFSSILRKSNEKWSVDLLDSFLKKPAKAYPRNRMAFSGLAKAQDRADLICYLAAE